MNHPCLISRSAVQVCRNIASLSLSRKVLLLPALLLGSTPVSEKARLAYTSVLLIE
jgi:hypothetical protein